MDRLTTRNPLLWLGLLLLVMVLPCVQIMLLKVAPGYFFGLSGTTAWAHSESRITSGLDGFGKGGGVGEHDSAEDFLGSDYLLRQIGADPDTAQKRLGDGLYEQRLIRQAVLAATGQRYLYGLNSDEAMFRYLMDNAAAYKNTLNLTLGISLTAAQVAVLTHDIVWLEEAVVNGERVLVPVLYLVESEGRLAANGALIQGQNLNLISGGELNNSGTLLANNDLQAVAGGTIDNSGRLEAGNRLDLVAGDTIVNHNGGLIAGRDVSLTAVNDIINERSVSTYTGSNNGFTQKDDIVDRAARIESVNDLLLQAGRDISNIGGEIRSGGDTAIQAGRDVVIAGQEEHDRLDFQVKRAAGYLDSVTQYGAQIETGGALAIDAGRDLSVIASELTAGRDLSLTAGGDVTIAEAANEDHSYVKGKKGDTKYTYQQSQSADAVGA